MNNCPHEVLNLTSAEQQEFNCTPIQGQIFPHN